jgi:tRNA G26 N,N-dimethylase Trm1
MIPFIGVAFGFWKGLPAPARKIAMYAGLAILAFWAFKVLYLNPYANKIAAETTIKVTEQVRKQAEASWKPRVEALAADKQALVQKVASLEEKAKELDRSRQVLEGNLATGIKQIRVNQEKNSGKVIAIPADKLDDAMRGISSELSGAKPTN